MRVPLSWLKEYVDLVLPPEGLAYCLTMAGVEVEAMERIGGNWDNVAIGQIKEVKPHPNADRLTLAIVDDGQGHTYQVITGAANIRVGDKGMKVPLALPGARLIDGHSADRKEFIVKSAKIRGVVSEAVICSEWELGISQDHTGILILEDEAPLGKPLAEYLGDTVFVLKPTPNQVWAFSIIGVAREVAALTRQKVRLPQAGLQSTGKPIGELVHIEVADSDLCPHYSASVVLGVKPAPSPLWLQRRLRAAGIRPINNIVDVTNYAMLEWGQPLHAFDYDKMRGKKIIVRRAGKAGPFTTLDGEKRVLLPDTLVIADAEGSVGIAGVMGGLDSEVSDSTRGILLESANFDRVSIRRTARALHIKSEASSRFEKGLDPESTVPALLRATQFIQELAGGEIAHGIVDIYPQPVEKRRVSFAVSEVERLLGLHLSREEIQKYLAALEFGSQPQGENELSVEVPTYRRDVVESADLVEEVARLLGYDQIPSTLLSGDLPEPRSNNVLRWEAKVREVLTAAGFYEAMTYSLVDTKSLGLFPAWEKNQSHPLTIANPMVPEENTLRTTLLPSLLRTVSSNLQHEEGVTLFEIAKVYWGKEGELPEEKRRLALVLAGKRGQGWAEAKRPVDFYDLVGTIENLLSALGVQNFRTEPFNYAVFHPGHSAKIIVGDHGRVGILGRLHPRLFQPLDLGKVLVYLAEMDFDLLISLATEEKIIEPLPRYPAVALDLALLVDAEIPARRVEELIREAGGKYLDEVHLFDVYQGKGLPKGKKSLAYSLTFRAPDRTLTEEEAAQALERIVQHLRKAIGATLRGPEVSSSAR